MASIRLEEGRGPHCLVRAMTNSGGRSTSHRSLPSDSHHNPRNGLDGNVDREEKKPCAGDRGRRTEEKAGAALEHSPAATAPVGKYG